MPDSALTRAAEELAQRRLSRALLNHSYRTYAFGAALGELENLDVDRELLYAAALLHDLTPASDRAARDVAEQVGLSTAATNILRTAIRLHGGPGVTLANGPVAYLLWAGAGLDVALGAPFRL
jgi:HD superfamily phosphohydrolase YqeK